jgi:O-antigen ligase
MDLIHRRRAELQSVALAAVGAVLVGAAVGRLLVSLGPTEVLALLMGGVVAVALLRSVWMSLVAVIAIVSVLPYATLPFGTSVTPAVLECVVLAALAITALVIAFDRRQEIRASDSSALVVALVGVTVATFVMGLGRGYSTQTLHDFFKFLLGIASFWIILQLVTATDDARRLFWILSAGTTAAAAIGLALYVAGPSVTERALIRLVPYGYPGSRIVRYIEDDPSRPMRAVGTSVDPNSFGGLLMVGFVLAVGQLIVRRRSMPVGLAGVAASFCGFAMLLTYSRGAWVGAFVGIVLIVVLRRPLLLIPLGAFGVAAVVLGLGSGFVERLWLGFTLQDPATKLRLDEYRNALAIIREHPWFGVGFGEAPSIDLQTGVSSIYLTIAERAGVIGLLVFLTTVGVIAWRGLMVSRRRRDSEDGDLLLCFTAALVAALAVGTVDHYFFNPQFPHMATLFWVLAGAITAMATTAGYARDREGVSSTQAVGSSTRFRFKAVALNASSDGG